jgi:hypothetical protein
MVSRRPVRAVLSETALERDHIRTPTSDQAVKEAFEAGTATERAMNRGFFAAVRLHRMHGIP